MILLSGPLEQRIEKGVEGIMEMRKTIIALLALLVAAMAIVPCVSACEGSAGCVSGNKTLHSSQTPEIDIFEALGVEKPSVPEGHRWQPYASSKKAVDAILGKSENRKDIGRIIAYLEGDSVKVVLYRGVDGMYYALMEKNGKIVMKPATVTELGSLAIEDTNSTVTETISGEMKKQGSSTDYKLRRISLPESETAVFGTLSVYEAHITRVDSWVSVVDPNKSADLTTEGIFTYDYGVQILDIEDYTNTHEDFMIDRCEFTHSTRTTSLKGYVESHVIWALVWPMPPKCSLESFISCSITGVPGGNYESSEWIAVGYGCAGIP